MLEKVLITPLSFLVKLQASRFQPTLYLKMDSLAGIFQGFWQLSRNNYLKEHFWTVSSKETKEMTASKETFFTHFKNFDT